MWKLFLICGGFVVATAQGAGLLDRFHEFCAAALGWMAPNKATPSSPPMQVSQPAPQLRRTIEGREVQMSLPDFRKRFQNCLEKFGDTPEAVLAFLKDESVIPRNGILHVIGPGANFREWMVPLLARPDIQIIVSEVPSQFFKPDNISDPRIAAKHWAFMKAYNPKLIEQSYIKTAEQYAAELKKRVWLTGSAHSKEFRPGDPTTIHPFNVPTPIPKADLILLFSPFETGAGYSLRNHIKDSGLIWSASEALAPWAQTGVDTWAIELPGEAGAFSPGKGGIGGQGIGLQGVLMVMDPHYKGKITAPKLLDENGQLQDTRDRPYLRP